MIQLDRFWSKVAQQGDCWAWTRALDRDGYGKFGLGGRTEKVHRLVYTHMVGPIPEGLELDHLCRNRACVNPYHMDPVTHAENVRRGLWGIHQSTKTHCPSGHEYTEENTRWYRGYRYCRPCDNARHRKGNHV